MSSTDDNDSRIGEIPPAPVVEAEDGPTLALAEDEVVPAAAKSVGERLPRGVTVGRYVVLDVVGEGGMGTLYKAYDPELDRSVALKLVRADPRRGSTGDASRERLLREARALARLAHPNVVAIYEVGTYGGEVFLAMEFVEGITVRAWLKHARRTHAEILQVFLAAGEGLAAAHRAGLVHRDFKPDNVIVGNDGRVRVLDFGLARAVTGDEARLDLSSSRSGSPLSSSRTGGSRGGSTGTSHLPASLAGILESGGAFPTPAPSGSSSVPLSGESSGDTDIHGSHVGVTARTIATAPPSSTGRRQRELLSVPLTRVGALMGTPRYMAPEQLLRLDIDGRADQFAFAVTLHEALYGTFPFEGTNVRTLRRSVTAGAVVAPPPGSTVPRWIRKVILRGLSPLPSERWPAMDGFLDALRKDPSVRRRRWLQGGAVALAVAGLVGFGVRAQQREGRLCDGAAQKLRGVWDDDRKRALEKAFFATGKPYAEDSAERVERAFDAFATGWTTMHTEACRATRVRGEQSEELLDLRMQCLGQRLDEVKALVGVFVSADAATVEGAIGAARSLPRLDDCADAKALRAPLRPPEGEARARVDGARKELATSWALYEAGRYKDGETIATASVAEAESIGYRPLHAESLIIQGMLLEGLGRNKDAEKSYRSGARAAEAGRHDDALARARIHLIAVLGERQGRYPDATEMAKDARSALDRVGADENLEAFFDTTTGTLAFSMAKYDEARTLALRALERKERIYGRDGHPAIATLLTDLGDIALAQGHPDEAIERYQRALQIARGAYGPRHPSLATILINLAGALRDQARYDESERLYEEALDIALAAVGTEHTTAATIQLDLGSLARIRGRLGEALRRYQRARGIWERVSGPEHPNVGTALYYEGLVYLRQGDTKAAQDSFQRARTLWEKALGADHTALLTIHTGLGDVARAQGKNDVALAAYVRAIAIGEKTLERDHPSLVTPLVGEGEVYIAQQKIPEALVVLRRALAIGETHGGDPVEVASTRFALARATAPHERAAARALAIQARDAFAAAGARADREHATVLDWLRATPP